jgi:hypothetical protein
MNEKQRAIMDLKNRAQALARGAKLDQNFCDDLIDATVEVMEKVTGKTDNTIVLGKPTTLLTPRAVPWRSNCQPCML